MSETSKPVVRDLFCAACQKETPQTFSVRTNLHKLTELISLCPCGRELKWPADATGEQLAELFQSHKQSNEGHVFVSDDGATEMHPVLDVLAAMK